MQETAFIWDLDGTLLDSYEAILAGIEETYRRFSLPYNKKEVRAFILKYSVQDLLEQVAKERGLDVGLLNQVRARSLSEKNAQVVLMSGAREVLAWADQRGIQQFVYTHKGDNALTILRDLGLDVYFTEILTSQSGFARKPNPEAASYLISKYHLKPERTYYIGDRLLDIEFALNSAIKSLNFLSCSKEGNQQIRALEDIITLLSNQ